MKGKKHLTYFGLLVLAILLTACGGVTTQLGSSSSTGISFGGPLLNPQTLTLEQLMAIEWTTVQVNTSAGAQNYAGIRLSSLLDAVGVQPEAETINFVTVGGQTVSLPIADVKTCNECILAVTQGGARLDLILPGFELSLWAEGVASASVE